MQPTKEYKSIRSKIAWYDVIYTSYKGIAIDATEGDHIWIGWQETHDAPLMSRAPDTNGSKLLSLHSNWASSDSFNDRMKCEFQIGLKGYHYDTTTGKSTPLEDQLKTREEYFFYVIRFVENAFDIKFPEDMIREICEVCKFTPVFKQDVEKLIEEGKYTEALESAKKIQDNSLYFEMGELLLNKSEYHIAKQFLQAIPKNPGYFYSRAQRMINDIDIILNQYFCAKTTESASEGPNQILPENAVSSLANIASIPTTTAASYNVALNSTVSHLSAGQQTQQTGINNMEAVITALQAQIDRLTLLCQQLKPLANDIICLNAKS